MAPIGVLSEDSFTEELFVVSLEVLSEVSIVLDVVTLVMADDICVWDVVFSLVVVTSVASSGVTR
jgi:hypothetical protein